MLKKPAYAVRLEEFLHSTLVGEILPTEGQMILGDFVVKTPVRIGQVMEDLTRTLIMKHAKGAAVNFEPHGKDTFPDIQISFNKENKSYLEVKTIGAGASSHLQVASLSNVLKAVAEQDRLYFDTHWIIWTWRAVPTGTMIENVEILNLFELAGRNAKGGVATELRSGSRNYIYRTPGKGFSGEKEFFNGLLRTIEGLPMSKEERKKHFKAINSWAKQYRD